MKTLIAIAFLGLLASVSVVLTGCIEPADESEAAAPVAAVDDDGGELIAAPTFWWDLINNTGEAVADQWLDGAPRPLAAAMPGPLFIQLDDDGAIHGYDPASGIVYEGFSWVDESGRTCGQLEVGL